jgi:hypothetical protein
MERFESKTLGRIKQLSLNVGRRLLLKDKRNNLCTFHQIFCDHYVTEHDVGRACSMYWRSVKFIHLSEDRNGWDHMANLGSKRKLLLSMSSEHRWTNREREVAMSTKLHAAALNTWGSSPVWNFLHITLLAPRILMWVQDFCKICATQVLNLSTLKFM